MKKTFSVVLLSLLALGGCAQKNEQASQTGDERYFVSEDEMKAFILKQNNVEQCIHPELAGMSYQEAEAKVYNKRSPAEKFLDDKYVSLSLLQTIGAEKYSQLHNSDVAWAKFETLFDKLNNQKANVDPAECAVLKKEYRQQLAELKKESVKKLN